MIIDAIKYYSADEILSLQQACPACEATTWKHVTPDSHHQTITCAKCNFQLVFKYIYISEQGAKYQFDMLDFNEYIVYHVREFSYIPNNYWVLAGYDIGLEFKDSEIVHLPTLIDKCKKLMLLA